MKVPFQEIITGFRSLLVGMRITMQQFFKGNVTVQYPHESLKMPERYRGHVELVRDPETGMSLCVACKQQEEDRAAFSSRHSHDRRWCDYGSAASQFDSPSAASLGFGAADRAVATRRYEAPAD